MANKFVRSMNDVNQKNGEIPLNLTNENDLISTKEKQHYIRRKDDYHCLTDNVKTIKLNGKELKPDLIKNQVTSPNLAEEVNGVKVSSNGKVTIDTGVMTVNGQKPDSKGDIVVSGSKEFLYVESCRIPQQTFEFYSDSLSLYFKTQFMLDLKTNIDDEEEIELSLKLGYYDSEDNLSTKTEIITKKISSLSSFYESINFSMGISEDEGTVFKTKISNEAFTTNLIFKKLDGTFLHSIPFPISDLTATVI